jgi:uncharacterized membrane protein YhaH (DUF805 family)
MQGRIVFFSADTRSGTILADEGSEFRFHLQAWRGNGFPPHGATVTFRVANAEAVDVTPAAAASYQTQAAQGGGNRVWFQPGATMASNVFQGSPLPGDYQARSGRPGFFAFYFTPSGRVSLGQYWFNFFLPCGALGLIGIAAVIFTAIYSIHHHVAAPLLYTVIGFVVLKFVILAWVSFMMHIKRFHDLNMSWGSGYMIETFMPFGRDWMIFRLMCEQGTPGPNAFGDDPRG